MTKLVDFYEHEDNTVCFTHLIMLGENRDPETWHRILDAFIAAVEAEGASTVGGMHPAGTHSMCGSCGPVTVCFQCGKDLKDE